MLSVLAEMMRPRLIVERDDYTLSLYEQRVQALVALCGLVAYGWLFVAWTASLSFCTVPLASDTQAPTVLLGACGLALLLRRRPFLASRALLCGWVAVLLLWPNPARYVLAPACVVLGGLLLGRGAALVTAGALTLLPGQTPPGAAGLWATALILWLSSDYIYRSLSQAAVRQREGYRLQQELLGRRQELRRLNDSLRNAYTLLERTNHELGEARDEAEQARRLKTQFAATISHELRTPLNLVLGFSEVMHKAPESYADAVLTPDLRGDIREIYVNTRHLLDLVDDVLDLSRIDQVRLAVILEEADPADIVREAASTVAGLFRGRDVRLEIELPDRLPRCTLDRTRIRQVLINLLSNAARLTDYGEVRVSAAHDEPHGEVCFCVSDTGPGVPGEERGRIFDAFYQVAGPLRRPQEGTGLGLAICRTFVQLHGGRIWLGSKESKGSRFYFTLPTHARPQTMPTEWRLPSAADPFGESIVTLDAESLASRSLQRALPRLQVHNATSLGEAGTLVSKWHPRAFVAFERQAADGLLGRMADVAAWPGLPVMLCQLKERPLLSEFPNVRLVLSKPVSASALLEATSALGPLDSLLVADDDEGMGRLVLRLFALHRPQVKLLAARHGEEALEILRRERPQAVILDLAMPQMDGLAVLEAMNAEGFGDVPVIVVTAMDLHGAGGAIVAQSITVSSCLGLGEAEVMRYAEALAKAAQPRYGAAVDPGEG